MAGSHWFFNHAWEMLLKGTHRSPPSDSQQMVQVWSTRLNPYHCTKFLGNLIITRLGRQSSKDKTGPATKKRKAREVNKVWHGVEKGKERSLHKENSHQELEPFGKEKGIGPSTKKKEAIIQLTTTIHEGKRNSWQMENNDMHSFFSIN
ncbi:hypothetical protein ACS0TY_014863 [Phlomoides rotata]